MVCHLLHKQHIGVPRGLRQQRTHHPVAITVDIGQHVIASRMNRTGDPEKVTI